MATASFQLCQGDPTTWGTPPVGKTFFGVNDAGAITIKQNDGSITVLTNSDPSAAIAANASGVTTVSPSAAIHSQVVNVTGAARTVPIVLATGTGKIIDLLVTLPSAPNFLLNIRNNDVGGVVLFTFDNSGDPVVTTVNARFAYISGIWVLMGVTAPAY